jgi:hypothetical protein
MSCGMCQRSIDSDLCEVWCVEDGRSRAVDVQDCTCGTPRAEGLGLRDAALERRG